MVKLKDDVNVDSIGREDYENFSDIEKIQAVLTLLGKDPITARGKIICDNNAYSYDQLSGEVTDVRDTFLLQRD